LVCVVRQLTSLLEQLQAAEERALRMLPSLM
jgi:hypothetical protein